MEAGIPTYENLIRYCLFCDPSKHGQDKQVLLHSDNLYLFAGLGAIIDGYILIAPYRCDDPRCRLRSYSEGSPALLDELIYLRDLIASFYRDVFGHGGMCFEHGQAGSCIVSSDETKHCHHAHLCCYPIADELWSKSERLSFESVSGFHGLKDRIRSSHYLLVQVETKSETGQRIWKTKVARVAGSQVIPPQYLRRLLAMSIGRPQLWDWREYPRTSSARRLVGRFREWLKQRDEYVVQWEYETPRVDFLASVARSNQLGNDRVAREYLNAHKHRILRMSLERFVAAIPKTEQTQTAVLDIGCGPGIYTRAFASLGMHVLGVDISEEMIRLARRVNRYSGENVAFENADMSALNLPQKSFDGIWASAVLVHVPRGQSRSTLDLLGRLLKKGGVLYLSTRVGHCFETREDGRIFVEYREDEIDELVKSSGLEMIDAWSSSSVIGTTPGADGPKEWKEYLLRRQNFHVA